MIPRSNRILFGAATMAISGLVGVVLSAGQAAPAQKPPMAEEVFKNVRVMKGIPVDEFMATMGVFSAALGISCGDCHTDSDTSWEAYALDSSPKKVMARRMIQMMGAINQGSFGGRQVVTCYTCHRGSNRPKVTANLARVYGDLPPEESADDIAFAPNAPPVDPVFDKYLQALGGRDRVAREIGRAHV